MLLTPVNNPRALAGDRHPHIGHDKASIIAARVRSPVLRQCLVRVSEHGFTGPEPWPERWTSPSGSQRRRHHGILRSNLMAHGPRVNGTGVLTSNLRAWPA